ncbi:Transcription factor MYB3R-1 [Vitis vinifera]|uniref:Transcription factor MYB3R-1 n=1 Tax=Vitis vinifera TaxID=29760 RepID=A0A438HL71_VITVI|nr:Transcription factor MYB3R-1 [Vitis vinifera]
MVEADECNADEKADEKQALGFSSTTVSDSDRSSADPKRVTGPARRSTKGFWTEQKDRVLAYAVNKFKGKNWKKIAECVTGTTDVQCLHRWQKVLDPNLVKGPWTKEEDDLIIELVGKQGNKKWAEVAKCLTGRIGKQCRERWHNHLNPAINKAPWTKEEELVLIQAHQKYGNKWAEIAKILPGRTENSIKNHWNCSLKKRLNLNASAFHLPGFPTNNLDSLKMERETENGATQVVKQSLGTTFSLDKQMESQSSVDTHLDLAVGYSSGKESHLPPFKKVNCRFPKREAIGPMKPPFQTIFDKKEVPECDLASGRCQDSAVNDKPSRDPHIKANKLNESCSISLRDQLTLWHSAKPGEHSPPLPHSGCIPPSSNSPLDEIGCNGKTNVLPHKMDLPVSAKRSLQPPKRMSKLLSTDSSGAIDSGSRGQSKNFFPSTQTHEVNGTNEHTEKCLNLEDKNLGGLCYEPLNLEGLNTFLQSGTFPRSDSYIQQSSSPVSSYTPASNGKGISGSCSSPESILRSAARSFKNTPSIIRKRNRTPIETDNANNNDGTGTEEKTDSKVLPKVKQLFLSPPSPRSLTHLL